MEEPKVVSLPEAVNEVLSNLPITSSKYQRINSAEARQIIGRAITDQKYWGTEYSNHMGKDSGPVPALDIIVSKNIERENIDPNQVARLLEIAKQEQVGLNDERRRKRMSYFEASVGHRFSSATLDNYQTSQEDQAKLLSSLKTYAADMSRRVTEGDGIVLFGSAGTGKTHLLVGLAKIAIAADHNLDWWNGQDLFGKFREIISENGSEVDFVNDMADLEILILDDVLPPGGTLTEYQASNLYRIVDRRYRNCRPTWATLNVADGEEASRGMGVQIVDRLRHGALTAFCNWPSYRKARG